MDSFKEQIVKKENTGRDTMIRVMIVAGSILLVSLIAALSLFFGGLLPIAIILGAGIIYGGYYLIQNLSLEYEYILTNGELDVDKIMAARSRKRLITIKIGDATDIGEYREGSKGDKTTVIASAMNSDMTDWYLDVKHPDHGDTRLIFTPNDEMLKVIKTHLPRAIRNKVEL